jgi:hypothetical protein
MNPALLELPFVSNVTVGSRQLNVTLAPSTFVGNGVAEAVAKAEGLAVGDALEEWSAAFWLTQAVSNDATVQEMSSSARCRFIS